MVLVRKSELACRNDWDQDLWDQGAVGVDLAASNGSERSVGTVHRPPSFSADMIPDPIVGHLQRGEIFTDKIQSVELSRRTPDVVPPPSATTRAAPDLDDAPSGSRSDVREARRRRQEQRTQDQRRHQQALSQEAGKLLSSADALDPPSADSAEQPTSASKVPGKSSPKPEDAASRRQRGSASSGAELDRGIGGWVEMRRAAGRFDEPKAPATTPGLSSPSSTQRGTEPLPIDELQTKNRSIAVDLPVHGEDVRVRPPRPVDPPTTSRPLKRSTSDRAAESYPRHSESTARDVKREPRLPLPFAVDPIDEAQVAATIPRCCATCRDFKRVGDGTRGWCANAHAFTQRRMVQSDDLSCRSSIGTWWLPSDDLWLERVDMTHHGRPTPLLDEYYGDDQVEGQGLESRPF